MLKSKHIDRLCAIVLVMTVLLTCAFMGAAAAGRIDSETGIGYEDRLFSQDRVHAIDIVIDDWDAFLQTCPSEEYAACTLVIDGEAFSGAAIRGKGNTSLSNVQSYGNDRYSFKVEFDHYQAGKTYHGLDKLSLNNLIQDKTYMKDYLAYTLMNRMGVAAPLCSFAQINVNGEPWGLYLAVEAVEDGFLQRNYGRASGELYKPDSMSFGGGRGNGRDFDMADFAGALNQDAGGMHEMPERSKADFQGFDPGESMKGGGFGGMGSSDVMLQYSGDDPASYPNIFDNAKTDVTEADQARLIASLKALQEGDATVVNQDAVMRYLAVHDFLCNGDSYTGSMVHNYYLYEENGILSMIPWDYNLAFGAFSMGGSSGATGTVNSPIDTPVSSGDVSSRPMIAWIFQDAAMTEQYHEIYREFIAESLTSGWLRQEIDRVAALIDPYVQAETNAFFAYDEFIQAVDTLKAFCDLRGQSILGQLDGGIPSTAEGQRANQDALVDASQIDLSDMGDFGTGGHGGERPGMNLPEGVAFGGEMPEFVQMGFPGMAAQPMTGQADMSGGGQPTNLSGMPQRAGSDTESSPMFGMPDGMTPPEGFEFSGEIPASLPGMEKSDSPASGEESEKQTAAPQQDASGEQAKATVQPDDAQDGETSQQDGTDRARSRDFVPAGQIGRADRQQDRMAGGSSNDSVAWILLAVSVAVLLGGILFAKFYRVNR